MCANCFPPHVREAVFKAGRDMGRRGEYAEPLPVGSVLRAEWEAGLAAGMEEIPPASQNLPVKAPGKVGGGGKGHLGAGNATGRLQASTGRHPASHPQPLLGPKAAKRK